MATVATAGKAYNEEGSTTIIALVHTALDSAGYPQCTLDASSQVKCSGYIVFPLFADAAGIRDGIAVVEHISVCEESARYVREYLTVIQANPYCGNLHMRLVKTGFSPKPLQLWVW